MKPPKAIILLIVFLIFNGFILGEYLDVGDDPDKIQIVETKVLVEGKLGKARFSPDGEYISVKYEGKILIFDDQGVKKHEIPKGFFSRWFPDSRKLFYHITFDEGYYFDLTTGKSHIINYKRKEDGYLVDITENNDLVLYTRKYRRDLKQSEYNFIRLNAITGHKQTLGIISNDISTSSEMKLISTNELLYKSGIYDFSINKFNFNTGKSIKLYSKKIHKLKFKKIQFGESIAYFEDGNSQVIMDKNYKVVCKFDSIIKRAGDLKIWTNDLIPSDCISVAPNGKLILFEMETGYLEDNAVSDGIYVFNCKGKYKKVLDLEPSYLGWSAKGNKLLIHAGRKVLLLRIRKT